MRWELNKAKESRRDSSRDEGVLHLHGDVVAREGKLAIVPRDEGHIAHCSGPEVSVAHSQAGKSKMRVVCKVCLECV
jgi:hypothetical protein